MKSSKQVVASTLYPSPQHTSSRTSPLVERERPDKFGSGSETERSPATLYLAAGLSLVASLVHLWAMPEHFQEWWGYGIFFLAAAVAQGLYAVALLRWQYRPLLIPGIAGNLAIMVFYTITRTFGIPLLGPHAGHTEIVGRLDLLGTMAELALVMSLLVLLQNLYRARVVLPGVLALGVALVGLGIFMTVGVFTGGGVTKAPASSFGITESVPTSFGVVAVEHAEKTPGMSMMSGMSGMNMGGMSGTIPEGKAQVEAYVTLTNQLDHPVGYSPEQFSLISDESKKPIRLTHATLPEGTLQPDASIEGNLNFLAPSDSSKLWVAFQDPANPAPLLIDIGEPTTMKMGNMNPQSLPVPDDHHDHGAGGGEHDHHDH